MNKPETIDRGRFLKITGLAITCATMLAAGPRGESQNDKPASPAAPIVKTGELPPQNNAAPLPRPPKPIADPAMTGNASLAQNLRQTLETTVLFSQPGDGRIWGRGLTYKASFGTEGFTYIPFLGASAPRSYPIGLTIASVTVNGAAVSLDATAMPSIEGQRITFNRGLVSEVYDLSPQAIEQTFVLNQPVQGAVNVRLAVASDMAVATKDGAIALDGPDNLGRVLYDQAAAVDAAQHRTPLNMALQNGQIAIDVPASVVAKAKGMLSIDPILSNATVNPSMSEADADVGFEPLSNHYCVAFEHQFSVTDHDIYSILMSNSGTVIVGSTATIDATGTNWRHPRVAGKYVGNQFLVVAQVGNAPTRAIWGTERNANLTTTTAQFQISDPLFAGDQHDPDVGGDPFFSGPTTYLVAWERDFSVTDHDILARRVNESAANTGAVILIENTTASIDDLPSVSSSDGAPGFWLVAWEHQFNPADHDIYGSTITFGGLITHTTFTIDASFLDERAVSVSTLANDGTFAVAYNYGDFDLWVKLVDNALATVVAEGNLGEIGGDPFNQVQRNPSIDSDGDKITVAFSEQFVSNDWDIWIQAFCRNGSFLRAAEARRVLDFTQEDDRTPRLVGRYSGGSPAKDSMTVWHSGGAAGLGNVYAGTYRTPFVCCPC